MRINVIHKGDFTNTERFLNKMESFEFALLLHAMAQEGVAALSAVTPVDTGKTAASWGYEIVQSKGKVQLFWTNSNTDRGVPIVILLHYGHAMASGYWVQGRDFINPAIRPIFDRIASALWREVMDA